MCIIYCNDTKKCFKIINTIFTRGVTLVLEKNEIPEGHVEFFNIVVKWCAITTDL